MTGPVPETYANAGLRIVPINPETKSQSRRGNCKAAPNFTVAPADWRPGEQVGIITGPCPAGAVRGGRLLCGLDLDGGFSLAQLQSLVGPLPMTLTSKHARHLYYWITPSQAERGELRQGNDVFKTKSSGRGALDLRPAAGGYFLERGDWDRGFDLGLVCDLPDEAHGKLLAARTSARRGRPLKPCQVALDAYPSGASPMAQLGEAALGVLADSLGSLWPRPGAGGGHDLALALGGVLADAEGSVDDVLDFASRIFAAAGAPDAGGEVLASFTKRRSGVLTGIFGWPTLARMLEASSGDPISTGRVLREVQRVIPGLNGAQERHRDLLRECQAAWHSQSLAEINAPGAPTYTEFKRQFLAEKKARSAVDATGPGDDQ